MAYAYNPRRVSVRIPPFGTALDNPQKKPNKFRNKKTEDGFDSKKERARFYSLKALEKAGEITGLEVQKRYRLVPPQDGERPVDYVADFVYRDKFGALFVEDVKGFKTPDYIIKRKLMLWVHKIKIIEI